MNSFSPLVCLCPGGWSTRGRATDRLSPAAGPRATLGAPRLAGHDGSQEDGRPRICRHLARQSYLPTLFRSLRCDRKRHVDHQHPGLFWGTEGGGVLDREAGGGDINVRGGGRQRGGGGRRRHGGFTLISPLQRSRAPNPRLFIASGHGARRAGVGWGVNGHGDHPPPSNPPSWSAAAAAAAAAAGGEGRVGR